MQIGNYTIQWIRKFRCTLSRNPKGYRKIAGIIDNTDAEREVMWKEFEDFDDLIDYLLTRDD